MLYYIIPPIIIIAGLAFLVSFLFRKMNQIPRADLAILEKSGEKKSKELMGNIRKRFSQFILKVLEKTIQRFKLFSLKFHNLCQRWFQSIKKKREQRASPEAEPEKKIEERVGIEAEKKEERKPDPVSETKFISRTGIVKTEEIKSSPMVSKKVVLPEQPAAAKNRLEEALIERIASNPQDIEAYERLGDYYTEQGNCREALECFRHVLKLSPLHRKAKISVRRLEKMPGE